MKGWTLTRVWKIDGHLVVAETATEAIFIMKCYYGDNESYEPKSIIGVSDSTSSYDAIIADNDDGYEMTARMKEMAK